MKSEKSKSHKKNKLIYVFLFQAISITIDLCSRKEPI